MDKPCLYRKGRIKKYEYSLLNVNFVCMLFPYRQCSFAIHICSCAVYNDMYAIHHSTDNNGDCHIATIKCHFVCNITTQCQMSSASESNMRHVEFETGTFSRFQTLKTLL